MVGEGRVYTMKFVRYAPMFVAVMFCHGLVSCGNAYDPSSGRGDDRFGAPRAIPTDDPEMYGPEILPGRYLQTVSVNTVFFNNYPNIYDRPDRILPNFTDVKVVSVKGSYVKVELINTGAVGYVPSMMLGEKRSPRNSQVAPQDNGGQLVPDITPDLIDSSRPAE